MAKAKRKTESPKEVSFSVPHRVPDEVKPLAAGDPFKPEQGKKRNLRSLIVGAILVLLVAFLLLNKGLYLAAVVDGKPVFRWQLNKILTDRFGQQTLEGVITEMLIASEAQKANVTVASEELKAREEEIVKNIGGDVKLEDLLRFQGISKADFDSQIYLQLTVEKILGKDIQITDADVDAFIATNRAQLSATDPGALKTEAKRTLFDKKIGEKLQSWFAELKQKAKILKYL